MEQQNKLTEEEKAYQALRTQDLQDMPDLWSRIDAGFEEEVTKQKATQKKGRTRQLVLVAAAVLIVMIAVPIGISSMRKSNTKDMQMEATGDMQATEAGMDEMADEAAAAETAPSSVAADRADESVNHVEDNALSEYQTITQVILTQYDAQGEIVQQFDSTETDGMIDKVQFLLESYQVLDWDPADTIQSDTPYYLLELKLQDGTSMVKVCYEEEKSEGKTVADLMQELQALKK